MKEEEQQQQQSKKKLLNVGVIKLLSNCHLRVFLLLRTLGIDKHAT